MKGKVKVKLEPNVMLEPKLEVQIFGSKDCDENNSITLDALVDTGFSGGISTSEESIRSIGAELVRQQEPVQLADDRDSLVDVYRGFVIWNGEPHPVDLYAMGGEETNIGTSFLLGKEVRMSFWPGGDIVIEDGWDSMPDHIREWLRESYPHLAH